MSKNTIPVAIIIGVLIVCAVFLANLPTCAPGEVMVRGFLKMVCVKGR